jgi:Zn-dependent protease
MQITDTLFLVVVIIFSAVVHEVMHGVAADRLGDPTARYAGRLTLNPIPHLDPVGSIILPLLLAFSGSPLFFAWAKPVPYNPYNLRPGGFSEAIVAAAGPFSNLGIALLTGLVIRLTALPAEVTAVLVLIIVVNVMLFLFNLIPVPPLDGSKILSALLPKSLAYEYDKLRFRLESTAFLGMGIVLVFIVFFGTAFGNLVFSVANVIAGT